MADEGEELAQLSRGPQLHAEVLPEAAEHTEAPEGQKTTRLTVTFFTNDIDGQGGRMTKHAHAEGTVVVQANRWHGLTDTGRSEIRFRDLDELRGAVEEALNSQGVVLHP